LIAWVLVAWMLPPLIAAALGWEGIWGSGSALIDYLIPIPVAGGMFHVPSFLICTLAVVRAPLLGEVGASRVRAALLGMTLAGVLLLLNLQGMLFASQVGSTFAGSTWQQNPVGLFLLSDGLLALAFTVRAPQRPFVRLEALTVLLGLLPAVLPVAMAWPRPMDDQPFRLGGGRFAGARFDETVVVYSHIQIHQAGFRKRAQDWASAPSSMVHPRFHIDSEDTAVMFTNDADAANLGDVAHVGATLCLYEDGTEPVWLDGAGDCFANHLSFSELIELGAVKRATDEPLEVRRYLAARELCAGRVAPESPPGAGLELRSSRVCGGLEDKRAELLQKFPHELNRGESTL
jgi:hypothetical protein